MAQASDGGYALARLGNTDVYGIGGDEIGTVTGLYFDREEKKVRFLDIAAGGFLGLGERHFLIPIGAVREISEGRLVLNQSREKVVNSPEYDPTAAVSPRQQRDVHEHYDLPSTILPT